MTTSAPMSAVYVTLTNLWGGQGVSLECHPQLNVFYGENGCGKSTVLRAIANDDLLDDQGSGVVLPIVVYDSARPAAFEFDPTAFYFLNELTTQLVVNAVEPFFPLQNDCLQQLGGGERRILAFFCSIAKRLNALFPTRESLRKNEGEGVVIIDDVDKHLHPKWQKKIVPRLLEVFPNCQFFISTHSPLVLNHVKPECLFHLHWTDNRDIIVEKSNESYGQTAERILEDLMGLDTTRPDDVSRAFRELFLTIDAEDFDKARRQIAELRAMVGADPDLVRANVLLRFMETSGE